MMAAEWGVQLPSAVVFILLLENRQTILAVHHEGETPGRIWPSTCQRHGSRGLHYTR
jgi:hypothetical protein